MGEGHLSDVRYENLVIHNSKDPISVTMDYDKPKVLQPNGKDLDGPKFTIENLLLRNITSFASTYSGEVCRGGGICKGFVFENIKFVGSDSWTCQDKDTERTMLLGHPPQKGCDCFTDVQGRASNVAPDISHCFKSEVVVV